MIALQTLISLTILLAVMVAYNQYRVDLLRDELFSIRDAMFDEARQGRVSFNSPVYEVVRSMLNGMIRFAHTVSLLDFVSYVFLAPQAASRAAHDEFLKFVDSASPAERDVCMKYVAQANMSVIRHIARSPFLMVMVLPPVVLFVLTKAGKDWASFALAKLRRPLQSLDTLAIGEGKNNSAFAGL